MKYLVNCVLAFVAFSTGAFGQHTAVEKKVLDPVGESQIFLPFDFYSRHRDEVGLTEEQLRQMQRIADEMRETSLRLEAERGRQTKELQQMMAENPIDEKKAMERFRAVLNAENELKALQFRGSIAMRNALHGEQPGKVQQLAIKENATRGAGVRAEFNERLQQLRAEIQKRTGGNPSPKLLEQLAQIEQVAKAGKFGEAKNQLEQVLRTLQDASP